MRHHPALAFACIILSLWLSFWGASARAQESKPSATAAKPSDALRLGGFVDGQFRWDEPFSARQSEFLIRDGALFLNKTLGRAEGVLDLPFSSASGDSGFAFATRIAQAFARYRYDNGFSWKIGQFSSLYGFESNHTQDLFFTNQGLSYRVVPSVHTGLAIGYELNDAWNVTLLGANHHDTGPNPSNKKNFGAKLGGKLGNFRGSVAGITLDEGLQGEQWLVDVLAGTDLGPFALDAQFDLAKLSESASVGAAGASTATSYMVHATLPLIERLSLGVRAELLKNFFLVDESKELTVGLLSKMNEALTTKLDFSVEKSTATSRAVAFSTVFAF